MKRAQIPTILFFAVCLILCVVSASSAKESISYFSSFRELIEIQRFENGAKLGRTHLTAGHSLSRNTFVQSPNNNADFHESRLLRKSGNFVADVGNSTSELSERSRSENMEGFVASKVGNVGSTFDESGSDNGNGKDTGGGDASISGAISGSDSESLEDIEYNESDISGLTGPNETSNSRDGNEEVVSESTSPTNSQTNSQPTMSPTKEQINMSPVQAPTQTPNSTSAPGKGFDSPVGTGTGNTDPTGPGNSGGDNGEVVASTSPTKAQTSSQPTMSPSKELVTSSPVRLPTKSPTPHPTRSPSKSPTPHPTGSPSYQPTTEAFGHKVKDEEEKIKGLVNDKTAEVMAGMIFFLGMIGMIFTAWQLFEYPDGLYASCCRLSIKASQFCLKIMCLPCKLCCGKYTGYTSSDPKNRTLFVEEYTNDLELT